MDMADCQRIRHSWVMVLRSQVFSLRRALKLRSASVDEAGETRSKVRLLVSVLNNQEMNQHVYVYKILGGDISSSVPSTSRFGGGPSPPAPSLISLRTNKSPPMGLQENCGKCIALDPWCSGCTPVRQSYKVLQPPFQIGSDVIKTFF